MIIILQTRFKNCQSPEIFYIIRQRVPFIYEQHRRTLLSTVCLKYRLSKVMCIPIVLCLCTSLPLKTPNLRLLPTNINFDLAVFRVSLLERIQLVTFARFNLSWRSFADLHEQYSAESSAYNVGSLKNTQHGSLRNTHSNMSTIR